MIAIKVLHESATSQSKSDFVSEIELSKSLGYHERLVNMIGYMTKSNGLIELASSPYCCLLVEYCANGDLQKYLRQRCLYMIKVMFNRK